MKQILATFGAWLVQRFGVKEIPVEVEIDSTGSYTFFLDPALVAFAELVVKQVEADLSGASGENKRHRAFAILRRKMPSVSASDTAKAIEVAVDRVA